MENSLSRNGEKQNSMVLNFNCLAQVEWSTMKRLRKVGSRLECTQYGPVLIFNR